jgi:phage-related protein
VLAYKKSETFRDIVDGALGVVKGTVEGLERAFNQLRNAAFLAWDWIVDHWKLALFAFGPIGAAIYEIVQHFDQIKAAAQGAWNWITDNFGAGIGKVSGPIIAGIDAITRAFRRVTEAVEAVVHAIGAIVGAIEDLIHWIGKIHFPHIPDLNPFNKSPAPGAMVSARGATTVAAGAGVTFNIYGAVDPEGTARAITRLLEQHKRRLGLAP